MSMHHDPELEDVLQDHELLHLAGLLRSARRTEPPLDDAFRSSLRRQLMQKAWEMGEGRVPWWRRLARPPALAWAGAATGVILIASVAVFMTGQSPSSNILIVSSPIADSRAVQVQQPILVKFSKPMDHASTEAAVQVTPATTVSFTWSDNTLAVQPTSGNLAPHTQYQVTIGPTAQTAAGQKLAAPQTITFVTQPAPAVSPSPTPTPTPASGSLLTGEHQVAALPTGSTYAPQWSSDSSTIYFVGAGGALDSVPAAGGAATALVADGVSDPAIAPGGRRLAYIRGGKIEVLTLATQTTAEVTTSLPPTVVTWVKDRLFWATADGIYTRGTDGPSKVAALPPDAAAVSIAPDGAHAIYKQAQSFVLLDLTTATSAPLGPAGSVFLGWSPDGSHIVYAGAGGDVVASGSGEPVATMRQGDPGWSSRNEVLLGSDTDLYEIHVVGLGSIKLANGTYRAPMWAPDGTDFLFIRGGAIWAAAAPPLSPEPKTLDRAEVVVEAFMKARLAQSNEAQAFLTDNGKQAYSGSGMTLLISGDPSFSRFYVLSEGLTSTQPVTARFVVRLVLSHGKLDVSDFEETLILQRTENGAPFLIDQAKASQRHDLGNGAAVVAVEVTARTVKVTFDSDLAPASVPAGVLLLDDKGNRIQADVSYANRTVTFSGLTLVPGSAYRLVVMSTVSDVSGRNVAAEYDLDLVGPVADPEAGAQAGSGTGPSPSPAVPSPTPAIPSPSPSTTP